MRKVFLPILIIATFLAACAESIAPASNATAIPSASPAPTPVLIREIQLETQSGTAYTLAWSPDGKSLAAASGAEITLISDNLKEIQEVLRPEGGALGVTWNPNQTQFATVNGFRNPTITLWDWDSANAQLTRGLQIQAGADQYGVAWSPDGKLLATLSGDKKSIFQIWDASSWEEIHTFDLSYTDPRRALNWSADSLTLYGAGESPGQMVILAMNIAEGTVSELGKFPVAQSEVFAVSLNADRIALSDPRGAAAIFDAASGEQLAGIKSVGQPVDLAWHPNGKTLAILSYEGTLQLWEIPR